MSYHYYPDSFPSIPEDMDAWSRPSDMAYGYPLAYDGSHARTAPSTPPPPPPPPQVGIAPSHNGATDALLIQYPIPRAPYIFTSTHNGPATYQALQAAASIVRPPIFPSASRPPVAHHQPLGPPLMPPLYLPVTEGVDLLDPLLPTQPLRYDTATLPSPDGQHSTPSTSSLFAALVPSLASSSEAPALENLKVTHQHTKASLVARSDKRPRPSPMAPRKLAPAAASTSSLAGALGNPETAHYEYRGHNHVEFVARLCIPLPLRSPHDPTRTFRVPLPPNTDVFFDPVSVGGVLGLACHQCSSVRKSRANPYIFENVDRARMSLDHAFPEKKICAHRGVIGADAHNVPQIFQRDSDKVPMEGFALGHLLTLMVGRQYKLWHCSAQAELRRTTGLRHLIGNRADVPSHILDMEPSYRMLYVVAIRRWLDGNGKFHYFPELEVRV